MGIKDYVNADTLARGLSAFDSENWAIKAGKLMLEHLHDLASARRSFAFETTLASRTFAPWIQRLRHEGYHFSLCHLWLPAPEMSIQRVRLRVQAGGHHVPEPIIRRRYQRGLENFFNLYLPMADEWRLWDSSIFNRPRPIAERVGTMHRVMDAQLWEILCQDFRV